MAEALVILAPIFAAMAASVILFFWRRSPFSTAMLTVSVVMLFFVAVVLIYLQWFNDLYSRSTVFLDLVVPAANAYFYVFWTSLPLLGLAHLTWILRRKWSRARMKIN